MLETHARLRQPGRFWEVPDDVPSEHVTSRHGRLAGTAAEEELPAEQAAAEEEGQAEMEEEEQVQLALPPIHFPRKWHSSCASIYI